MLNKTQRREVLIEIADMLIGNLAEEMALTGEIHYGILEKIITLYGLAYKIKDGPDDYRNEYSRQ